MSEAEKERTEEVRVQVNLFATSRFISEVTSHFERCIINEIRAQDDDDYAARNWGYHTCAVLIEVE
jgi:hypothetical protein